MVQTPQDAAPKGGTAKPRKGKGESPLTAAQVAAYLRAHPDFLCKNLEILDVLTPPGRVSGNGVTDMQQYLVEKLRRDMAELSGARDELVVTGRGNLSAQSRMHEAVLALLKVRSFEHFIETLTTDLVVILGLDVIVVGVEQSQDGGAPPAAGVAPLAPKTIDNLLGPGQAIALSNDITGDPEIFGPGAGLVHSQALIRLSLGSQVPAALLAFGARDPAHFEPGMGTELLNFLARVVETSIRGWLDLPE